MFLYRLFFLTVCALLPSVSAYQVSQSCFDKGVGEEVEKGMRGAFRMVDSARRHLRENPYSPETSSLIKNLFLAKGNMDPQSNRAKMEKVEYIFGRIDAVYSSYVPLGGWVPPNDVVRFGECRRATRVFSNERN
jgi:hypothetical protein